MIGLILSELRLVIDVLIGAYQLILFIFLFWYISTTKVKLLNVKFLGAFQYAI